MILIMRNGTTAMQPFSGGRRIQGRSPSFIRTSARPAKVSRYLPYSPPTLKTWKYPLTGYSNSIRIQKVIIITDTLKVIRLQMPPDFLRGTLSDANSGSAAFDFPGWNPNDPEEAFLRQAIPKTKNSLSPTPLQIRCAVGLKKLHLHATCRGRELSAGIILAKQIRSTGIVRATIGSLGSL